MFTFSSGFEAATLKIPNKDLNGYGGGSSSQSASALRSSGFSTNGFPNSNIGASGFSVDYNPDGNTAWPLSGHPDDHFNRSAAMSTDQAGHGAQIPTMPPRKQIIGFAKFKTRQEALEARDVLQGRRVDIEKGAVLKAEMAKKNLHTKRGVGPLGLPMSLVGTSGTVGSDALANLPGMNGLLSPVMGNGEALTQRERELGALGAMGLLPVGQRVREREREEDEKLRRNGQQSMPVISDLPRTTGAGRDDDDKEHRRREKDASKPRMSAYDAFHSIPVPGSVLRQVHSTTTMVSPPEATSLSSYPFPNTSFVSTLPSAVQAFSSQDVFAIGSSATWGKPLERYMPPKLTHAISALPPRPPSTSQSSPPGIDAAFVSSVASSSASSVRADGVAASPTPSSSLPHGLPARPLASRPFSPSSVEFSNVVGDGRSGAASSSSSVTGSHSSENGDLIKTMTNLNMGTHHGMTSPQLPSPASGGSSATANNKTNGSDQNPPVSHPPHFLRSYIQNRSIPFMSVICQRLRHQICL